jgi:hypothetical protein
MFENFVQLNRKTRASLAQLVERSTRIYVIHAEVSRSTRLGGSAILFFISFLLFRLKPSWTMSERMVLTV